MTATEQLWINALLAAYSPRIPDAAALTASRLRPN